MRVLTLIRGLPGSGKSTLARTLKESVDNSRWTEADMYFLRDFEEYHFDPSKLADAHRWCLNCAIGDMQAKVKLVIVSNTFSTMKEMLPYIREAEKYGYKVQVIECIGNFGSIHNVPQHTIARMKERWETFYAS